MLRRDARTGERGAAVTEFTLVSVMALAVTLGVVQLALFLYQRNVVMSAASEGARVAASFDRELADGTIAANELIQQTFGGDYPVTVTCQPRDADEVECTAAGELPTLVPGLPDLKINITASMHEEGSFGEGGS